MRQTARGLSPTTHIGFKAAQTHYYASQQAKRLGLPFTHQVVINFAGTKVDPRDAVRCFGKIRRDDFAKWATPRSKRGGQAFPPTYAYTFENVLGDVAFMTMEAGDPHNVHVNWQVHLPAARVFDFTQQVWKWVEVRTGGITGGASTIFVGQITTSLGGYDIKGALPSALARYGRGQKHVPQGLIVGGRRAGTSTNLGPTARRALDAELGIRRSPPPPRPKWWASPQPTA